MAPSTTTSSILPVDVETKLQRLSQSQSKWQALPKEDKLELLEEIDRILTQDISMEDWNALGEWTAGTMMGYSTDSTAEGAFVKTVESVIPLLMLKSPLERWVEAYKMACGKSTNAKVYADKLQPKVTPNSNGQVVLDVFPLLNKDKFGPNAGLQVEWWLDPQKVKNIQDAPKPFSLDYFSDCKQEGVLLVLGAGNHGFLTLVDLLEGLFTRQRTVLVKQHPLRGVGLEPLMRKLFKPLYEQGYLESILDLETLEANSALVYHPLVTAIHMTGGKATHDNIVWGPTAEEQAKRKEQRSPKLDHAEMTSELGCITPWIMVPEKYSRQELQHHADILVSGLHGNASANCLAPKVILMDEHWDQKDEFVQLVKERWQSLELPVAYYPGSVDRWTKYQEQYPNAKIWNSAQPRTIQDRQLAPPMMNVKKGDKEATVLPLLSIDVTVDLSTPEGKTNAQKQYAFQQEPFCPVATFVTIVNKGKEMKEFLDTAVTLCNDYLYGSLSCSMSLPASVEQDPAVERAISNLLYGCIGINLWTGLAYSFSWGGHSAQESLENIESGLGRIGNYLYVPHLQKSVVKAPFVWSGHMKVNPDYVHARKELEAVAAFVRSPGLTTFLSLIAISLKLPSLETISLGVAGAVGITMVAMAWMRHTSTGKK